MKIQLDDSPYANLSYYFDRVADKVDEVRRKGGRIVIHCVAGVSRSATLIIAYLIKYKKMTLRQAYNFVKVQNFFMWFYVTIGRLLIRLDNLEDMHSNVADGL